VFCASALAGLVSPYGVEGFMLPIALLKKLTVDRELWLYMSTELLSPLVYLNAADLTFLVVAFFAQIAIGALSFLVLPAGQRLHLFRLLIFAAFTYLALSAIHNINLFAIVAGTVMMWNLADGVAARPRWQAWIRAPGTERAAGALLVILIVWVGTGTWHRAMGSPREFGLAEQKNLYMHGPARFAARDGMPRRAFVVPFAQGAVYEFHNAPERLAYLDGRLEHRQRSTIRSYLRARTLLGVRALMARRDREVLEIIAPGATSPAEWPAILLDSVGGRFQIEALLANPEWRVVFADRTGAVFVSRELADRLALPKASVAPIFARGR
jgi:hypothetical protein